MTYQYSTKPEGITYVCEATANIDGMKVRIVKEIAAASMAKAAAEFEEHLDGGIDEKGFENGFGHHNFTIDITEKGTTCPKYGGTGYEIKEPCDAPNPESATQSPLPVSDATQYKVGDWVEIESSHVKGKTFVSVIKEMPNQEHYTVRVNSYFGGYTVYGVMERQIIRKLKPSEIIVRIRCLSGTIQHCLFFDNDGEKHDAIKIFNSNGKSIAIIQLEALDTETRSLVESLLKAQEEEEK